MQKQSTMGMLDDDVTKHMLHYLDSRSFDYMILLHDPTVSAVRNDLHMQNLPRDTHEIDFSFDEKEQIQEFVNNSRKAFNCQSNQFLMMGIAWVIPKERELFHLFPEVITVDTTAATNNELRPLLVISAKDSNGKMFTVLRAFLPNEQAWVFRWIFSVVLPKIFGLSKLKNVKLIISDGDSQEM